MIPITEWPGLATNASPYAIPPGAAVTQVNLQALIPGQLSVRPGSAAVSFSSHAGSTHPVRRLFRYPKAVDSVVYQNSNGQVIVGTGPS
jgi:hypothetical protein